VSVSRDVRQEVMRSGSNWPLAVIIVGALAILGAYLCLHFIHRGVDDRVDAYVQEHLTHLRVGDTKRVRDEYMADARTWLFVCHSLFGSGLLLTGWGSLSRSRRPHEAEPLSSPRGQ